MRAESKNLNKILGKKYNVLNDGFIRVIDYMGTDDSIVQAARVSYGSGTKTISSDTNLIRYLLRNRHTTPFEMCEIKLHIRVPMDTWRQWIRHRTANVNEYSTRYSLAIDSMQTTSPKDWRVQSKSNRQGSSGFFDSSEGEYFSKQEKELQSQIISVYKERIDKGMAREQARKDLPLSTYTEAYWKIDLHNLLNFLTLRMDSHAQFEIRQYARKIFQILYLWCPITYRAFKDYTIGSIRLSKLEQEIISCFIDGRYKDYYFLLRNLSDREGRELKEKFYKLGLLVNPNTLNKRKRFE
jgi:thymidylate synthase (FAD)